MGRRKIEIKAIKDDRNRSVTFLKRKGGLFKKAHELSVLCQVDVAVIIFGHNKKLYEFSSGDINETIGRYQYYGGAHEHKGPEDFMGKKDGGSDDEDEDVDEIRPESRSPPQPTMAQHLHAQHQFNHMGSASPPMPNGAFHRGPSPQPPHNISRPASRAHIRQPSSHLMPPQHPQHLQVTQPPQPQQPSYAYMPNPPIYNPQAAAGMQARGPQGQPLPPQFQQYAQPGQPHPQQHSQQHPPPHPSQHPGQHPQQHPQVQQIYAQEQQRRQSGSVPPQFPQQQSPPQPQERQAPQPQPSPQPQPAQNFGSPPHPQPKPLPAAAKTHSIFTPIDDSRSLLAQHWGSSRDEIPKSDPSMKADTEQRSQSIDVASINRGQPNGISQPPQANTSHPPSNSHPQRTASTPVIPSIHAHPPSRTNSLQAKPRGPKLKVQIPNEDSEDEKMTAETSPQATAAASRTPIRDHPGVVLPPPSPSASALLSAGASGPPNPFARPPPPGAVNGFNNSRSDLETPISALPSRFVSDQLLPSPSSFYAEWYTNGNSRDSNMLPSPLNFPTPVVSKGPGFGEDEERKRRLDDSNGGTPEKRIKT